MFEPTAPFYSSEGSVETCYYLEDTSVEGWDLKYQPISQCHLTSNSDQRERFCPCCAGCLFINPEGVKVISEHIGQGETWMEIIDRDEMPSCGVYNYREDLANGADCGANNPTPQMPVLCEKDFNSKHYVLSQKGESCTDACEGVVDPKYGRKYECNSFDTSSVQTKEEIRKAAAMLGILCTHYPGEDHAESKGGNLNPSVQYGSGAAMNCYERTVYGGGTTVCSEKGSTDLGTYARQRICVCRSQ